MDGYTKYFVRKPTEGSSTKSTKNKTIGDIFLPIPAFHQVYVQIFLKELLREL